MADLTMTSLCYYCTKQDRKECDKERGIMPADSDYSYQHCSHQWVAKCSEFESKYESVRHGKWLFLSYLDGMERKCSECGDYIFLVNELEYNYCPHCGAKMDGD